MHNKNSTLRTLRTLISGAVFLSLLTVCATAKSKPGWIDEPALMYPSEEFIVGVGRGADVAAARADALSEISGVFNTQIEQVIKIHNATVVDGTGSSFREEMSVDTQSVTATEFEGAEAKERWCCESGKHVVLMVLDRAVFVRSVVDRMKEFEVDIANTLAGRENVETPLEVARLAMDAIPPAQDRDKLLARYRVASGKGWPTEPATSALHRLRKTSIDDATFIVDANIYEEANGRERSNRPVVVAMEKIVNQYQFKLARRENQATMKLACLLNLGEPYQRKAGASFEYRWEASCEIGSARSGGRAILVAEESRTSSGNSKSQSKLKAIAQSKKAMLWRMKKELKDYMAMAGGS